MPLKPGKANEKSNFSEFRAGKTFGRTANKFGIGKARKQMQAVVLKESSDKKYVGRPKSAGKKA